MSRTKISKLFFTLFALVLLPSLIHAGGPLRLFDNGVPYKYDVSGPVPIFTDLGAFRTLAPAISNERADELVAFGFQQLTDVATSNFHAQVAGDFASLGLPDIIASNAGSVFGTFNGCGIHVVYDVDGTIIRDFFGASQTGTLGIASPEFSVAGTNTITESWVVINGRSVSTNDPNAISYAGVFTHEFGHSVNLAHSQVNGAVVFSTADPKGPAGCTTLPYSGSPVANDIETMYPFIATSFTGGSGIAQSTVDRQDDKTSISNLYPAPGYLENNGSHSFEWK